jgi:hypothetical protein
LALLVRTFIAAVLLVAAISKLRAPRQTADALETYDVPSTVRLPLAFGVAAAELFLAIALALGAPLAPFAAAVFQASFALANARALLKGRNGAPCGCFGPRSRVGRLAVARDAVLAALVAAVPALPNSYPSTVGWLAIGLVAAFVCIAGLSLAVLALTRELGLLHLRLPRDIALDVAEEGPALGSHVDVITTSETPLTLAVFSSDGCRMCQALEPVVSAFASDRSLTVKVFDELRDADVWKRLTIPGSPYAVALDQAGEVRAKGTFNSYGQLEAIVAAAMPVV